MTDAVGRLTSALANRYSIQRELGHGGMAIVYLAEDLKHHRQVAIKVLRPELAAALGPDRFLREIETAARLNHPHILPLHDSGDADGLLYYVMPFVEGESLRDRLSREGQLPLSDAFQIVREVSDALSYAHSHDVIHRDIKPENIMLSDGHSLVTDFGIARAFSGIRKNLTEPGLAVGTPAYMSPEQALGEQALDKRSDVYSLGCVLYEMIAGVPPYTGSTPQAILARRLTEPVPPLRALRDTVSIEVERAICKALAKDPADRFANPMQFSEALVGGRAVVAPEQSIAVLPFINLSADPENEYFSDGMTEEIINALTQIRVLRVAARTSSFAFKNKPVHIRAVADELQVATVLEGSVRKAGNRLRITVQLTNAADGYQLWSERYDREMDDIFAVQDEIARAIVERLRITLRESQVPLVRPGTANLDAYDLYLKGRYFWARRGDGLHKAIDFFQQAVSADPNFAPAYAGLADTYCILGVFGYMPSTTLKGKARDAAERAIALDDRLGEGHCSLGLYEMYFGWDLDRAEREFRRAIELNPWWALPHVWMGILAAAVGRREEALHFARRGQGLEPLSPLINALAGAACYYAESFDDVALYSARAIELEATFMSTYVGFGEMLADRGEYGAAISAFEMGVKGSARSPYMVSLLGSTYARAGRGDEARELITELEKRDAGALYPALIYWELGEADIAIALLERAFEQRNGAAWLFGKKRLAGDPRWVALLKAHGLGAIAASLVIPQDGSLSVRHPY
jgi:eukaryotic-like serine/threonine-protein kinase